MASPVALRPHNHYGLSADAQPFLCQRSDDDAKAPEPFYFPHQLYYQPPPRLPPMTAAGWPVAQGNPYPYHCSGMFHYQVTFNPAGLLSYNAGFQPQLVLKPSAIFHTSSDKRDGIALGGGVGGEKMAVDVGTVAKDLGLLKMGDGSVGGDKANRSVRSEAPPAVVSKRVATGRFAFGKSRDRGAKIWVVKKSNKEKERCGGDFVNTSIKFDQLQDFPPGVTTVMMRHIPNKLSYQRHLTYLSVMVNRRDQLLNILDEHCQEANQAVRRHCAALSAYDFVYLPIDFKRLGNKGYAFVNFTTAEAATRFRQGMRKHPWTDLGSKKECDVSVAKLQGKEALVKQFQNSVFPCHTESFLPLLLSPPRNGFGSPSVHRVVGKCASLSSS